MGVEVKVKVICLCSGFQGALGSLSAFFARYLAEIGYSEAFEWLKAMHSKCMSHLNDFRRGLNENLDTLENSALISLTLATGFTHHNYYPREVTIVYQSTSFWILNQIHELLNL